MKLRSAAAIILMMALFACKEKQKSQDAAQEERATYFSISGFFDDQWKNRDKNPYTLLRVLTINGQTDSSFVPLDSALWHSLKAKFAEADISDPKFLDQYNFDMFDDETTETTHLHYQAKNEDLLLQKMDVGANMFTNLVQAVYLETRKESGSYLRTQKMQYIPDRIFQFQEYEKTAGAPEKNMKLEYRYNY